MNHTEHVYEVDHPLVQAKLSQLRAIGTTNKEFRELVFEITTLLAYEATKCFKLKTEEITTPIQSYQAPVLDEPNPVIVPILRAGLGMVGGLLKLMPSAHVGHIGLYRDETTLDPHFYYFKIPPEKSNSHYFVCDPMLATGGSACYTINELKQKGISQITFICLVAAAEGLQKLHKEHPNLPIYTASIDEGLNEKGYIYPGLGDAGDRQFGTQ